MFASAGDYNNDGLDDIVVAVSQDPSFIVSGGSPPYPFVAGGVYIVFGRANGWSGTIDVARDADVTITGLTDIASVANAGDQNGDNIDDLLIGHSAGDGAIYIFHGRTNAAAWSTSTNLRLLEADFSDAGAASLDGFTATAQWHATSRRSSDAGHGGPHSAYFGQETTGTYDVGAATSGTLTSGIDQSCRPPRSRLTFNYFLKTEPIEP